MSVLEKILDERKEILNKFENLEDLKKQVEMIERELSIFGTKESILEDIKELNDLITLQNISLPLQDVMLLNDEHQINEDVQNEEYATEDFNNDETPSDCEE